MATLDRSPRSGGVAVVVRHGVLLGGDWLDVAVSLGAAAGRSGHGPRRGPSRAPGCPAGSAVRRLAGRRVVPATHLRPGRHAADGGQRGDDAADGGDAGCGVPAGEADCRRCRRPRRPLELVAPTSPGRVKQRPRVVTSEPDRGDGGQAGHGTADAPAGHEHDAPAGEHAPGSARPASGISPGAVALASGGGGSRGGVDDELPDMPSTQARAPATAARRRAGQPERGRPGRRSARPLRLSHRAQPRAGPRRSRCGRRCGRRRRPGRP